MSRLATIVLSVSLALVGLLFFISGYTMSRGLLHARLPKLSASPRKASFDVTKVVSTDEFIAMGEGKDEFAQQDLDSLSGIFSKKPVVRTPSPRVEKKKLEPLMPVTPSCVFPFRWMG
jgi:hypothetical protein